MNKIAMVKTNLYLSIWSFFKNHMFK